MNILFVCRYNRFRSKLAEAFFKKINKNKSIKVKSAGLFIGSPVSNEIKKAALKFGLIIKGKPRAISSALLRWQDMIVVVADDVPPNIFGNKEYKKKTLCWKISDTDSHKEEIMIKVIKQIKNKVENLVKELRKV